MRKIENAYEEKISELFHQYEALSDSGLLYKFVFAGEMDEEEALRRVITKRGLDDIFFIIAKRSREAECVFQEMDEEKFRKNFRYTPTDLGANNLAKQIAGVRLLRKKYINIKNAEAALKKNIGRYVKYQMKKERIEIEDYKKIPLSYL